MKLIEVQVFVVLKLTRGSSEVVAIFHERVHAEKFIAKMTQQRLGSYKTETSTLYSFEPYAKGSEILEEISK